MFCNAGAIATFTKDRLHITLHGEQVFEGYPRGKLWYTNIDSPTSTPNADHHSPPTLSSNDPKPSYTNDLLPFTPYAQLVQPELRGTNAQRIRFYQRTLCYPTRSTLYNAARYLNAFRTFPFLTPRLISRHYQLDEPTALGRLDRTRKNYASTKVSETFKDELETNSSPAPLNTRDSTSIPPSHHEPRLHPSGPTTAWTKTCTLYTDLSGRLDASFYILVMYFEDLNIIYTSYLKDKSGQSYRKAYSEGLDWYADTQRGRDNLPKFEICDNAIDRLTAAMLKEKGISYTLVPAGNHRRNKAERTIRTAENYLTCAFSGCDPTCPKEARQHMFPQIRVAMNLLRPSRLNPTISAWEDLKGPYDWNATPMAPLGSPVIAFVSPSDRPKLAPHGVPAFYVGPAFKHYRCYTVYIPSTNRLRIVDTVAWLPYTNERIPDALPGIFLPPPPPPIETQLNEQEPPPNDIDPNLDYPPPQIPSLTLPPAPPQDPRDPQIRTGMIPPSASEGAPKPQESRPPSQKHPTPPSPPTDLLPSSEGDSPGPTTPPKTPRSKPHHHDRGTTQDLPLPPPADYSVFPHGHTPHSKGSHFANLLVATGLSLAALNMTAGKSKPLLHNAQPPNMKNYFTNNSSTTNFFRSNIPPDPPISVPVAPPLLGTTAYSKLRQGPDQEHWDAAFADELRRLVFRTKSITWIKSGILPQGRTATYANPVGRIKSVNGQRTFRIRLTYGGDRSDFDGNRTSYTVEYTTAKCLLNAVVTENAEHITLDLEDFYLFTDLERPEYMRMPIAFIPMSLRVELGMDHLPDSSSILWEVNKGLYGMPQAGLLAQQELNKLLAANDYIASPTTAGLYTHRTRKIQFVVWVDDFLIKFKRGDRKDINHLLDVLSTKYKYKVDWSGRTYLGMTILHQHRQRKLTISMPGFVDRLLRDLNIVKGAHDPRSPMAYVSPTYATGPQLEHEDNTPLLDPAGVTFIQRVVGKCLFFGRIISPLIECATNKIGSVQSRPTQAVLKAALRLCQYLAHHPDHSITYRPSNMRLVIHTDAAHNSESRSRSRAGGIFYLGDPPFTGINTTDPNTIPGPIATVSTIIPTVCQASSESEYAAAYLNAQRGESIRQTLADLGYPQIQPTPMIYDNEVAGKIADQSCKLKRAKAIAMRYHWLRDRVAMGHFTMVWRPGPHNLADLLTKAHPVHHFEALTPFYNSSAIRGY